MYQNSGDMLSKLFAVAHDAGQLLRNHPRQISAATKLDATPVTAADIAAHELLVQGLKRAFGPNISILSEEASSSDGELYRPEDKLHVIIDPLDGTSNFCSTDPNKSKQFAALLGVVQKDGNGFLTATHGIAVLPDHQMTLVGNAIDKKLEWMDHRNGRRADVVLSTATGQQDIIVPQRFIDRLPKESPEGLFQRQEFLGHVGAFREATGYGTARGTAAIWGSALPVLDHDVSARFYRATKPTERPGDWDLAAWDAILKAGQGNMTDLYGLPVMYGQASRDYKHKGFICWKEGNPNLAQKTLGLVVGL